MSGTLTISATILKLSLARTICFPIKFAAPPVDLSVTSSLARTEGACAYQACHLGSQKRTAVVAISANSVMTAMAVWLFRLDAKYPQTAATSKAMCP